MALPVGVTAVQVFIKAPVSFAGALAKVHLEVTPSVRLVHAATGTPLVEFTDVSAPAEGSMAQVTLPHTEQAGFQDASGAAVTSWHYRARIKFEQAGVFIHLPVKVFSLLSGQTAPVDLSLIPSGTPSPPTVGPVASALSVNGATGHVTGIATVTQSLADAARDPEALFTGAITVNASGAPTSAAVLWPDGSPGTYTGTPSTAFPTAIDSYTVTYGNPVTKTYTQPAVTRNSSGAITTRPTITTA